MSVRVQVVMDEEEREEFRRRAEDAGMSLSAWMREAAQRRAKEDRDRDVPADEAELEAFFERCDARHSHREREPDLDEIHAIIERSRTSSPE